MLIYREFPKNGSLSSLGTQGEIVFIEWEYTKGIFS